MCRLPEPHAICATCYASGEQMWTGTTWKSSIFISFAQRLSVCPRRTARESALSLWTSNSEKQSQRGGLSPCRNGSFCFLERTRSSVPTSELPEHLDCLVKRLLEKQTIWPYLIKGLLLVFGWWFLFIWGGRGGGEYVYWSQSEVCCIQCVLIKQTPLKNCMLVAHAQKWHTSPCTERWDFILFYLQKKGFLRLIIAAMEARGVVVRDSLLQHGFLWNKSWELPSHRAWSQSTTSKLPLNQITKQYLSQSQFPTAKTIHLQPLKWGWNREAASSPPKQLCTVKTANITWSMGLSNTGSAGH